MRHIVAPLLVLLCSTAVLQARIETIAVTGTPAVGTDGATFAEFPYLSLNASGSVAFSAKLINTGAITSENDHLLSLYDGNLDALARTGVGGVPDVAGGSFGDFFEFALSDSGELITRASLQSAGGVNATNDQGFWSLSPAGGKVLARTGDSVNEIPGATVDSLGAQLRISRQGQLAYRGNVSGGGASTSNNGTLWTHDGATGVIRGREGTSAAPGTPGANFLSFGLPETNDHGEVVFRGALNLATGVTNSNRNGIWKLSAGGDLLLARSGSGDVPGLPGSDFAGFHDPVINNRGDVAFYGYLSTGVEGLWQYDAAGNGQLIARSDGGNVPGIPDADFWFFGDPRLSPAGQLAYVGVLRNSESLVTDDSNEGIWTAGPWGDKLVARSGSGAVPGVVGADFETFFDFDINTDGDIATLATLVEGIGGVTSGDALGIWLFPQAAAPELVIRTGDTLAGRIVAELSLLGDDERNIPARFFNDANQIAFHAVFTNGDAGLFLYTPGSSISADFNGDTFVNAADLLMWQNAIGITAAADADGDGDTDGRDFLLWQRQFSPASNPLRAIPEPGFGAALLTSLACGLIRTHRK